jgi:hypothetical protein
MKDWRELSEQGSKKIDPHHLMGVLEELDRILDEERQPTLILHRSDDASEDASVEVAKRLPPKVGASLFWWTVIGVLLSAAFGAGGMWVAIKSYKSTEAHPEVFFNIQGQYGTSNFANVTSGPDKMRNTIAFPFGQEVRFDITIANTGDAAAKNLVVQVSEEYQAGMEFRKFEPLMSALIHRARVDVAQCSG